MASDRNPNDPLVKLGVWWDNLGTTPAYNAWKASVPDPTKPPAPAAPQTADQLTNWTPDQMYQATGQASTNWAQNSITYTPEPPPPPPAPDNTYVYLAIVLGGISLFIAAR